jgi:hypothetical protein
MYSSDGLLDVIGLWVIERKDAAVFGRDAGSMA